jgi:hydrogenase maturation factor
LAPEKAERLIGRLKKAGISEATIVGEVTGKSAGKVVVE